MRQSLSLSDKMLKPAMYFALGHWMCSALTITLLVKGLGRYQNAIGPWNVIVLTWMSYFVLSGIALFSFMVGSATAQSKVLWLLPPLPRRVSLGLGACLALGWFVVELIRPASGSLPSWLIWLYFLILPGILATGAERVKARNSEALLDERKAKHPIASQQDG